MVVTFQKMQRHKLGMFVNKRIFQAIKLRLFLACSVYSSSSSFVLFSFISPFISLDFFTVGTILVFLKNRLEYLANSRLMTPIIDFLFLYYRKKLQVEGGNYFGTLSIANYVYFLLHLKRGRLAIVWTDWAHQLQNHQHLRRIPHNRWSSTSRNLSLNELHS